MIQLSESDYLAEGLARTCYFHPENENLCIKIGKPDVEVSHLYKEINYYKKINKKDASKFDYPFYAMYHGTIETNLGEGFVYDLVRDETSQEVSKTLIDYIRMKDSPIDDSVFDTSLKKLQDQMIKYKVFASDLRPRNLCCKILKDGSVEMIIVDGIGHRDFLPLGDWFHCFAKQKVERRFQKIALSSVLDHRQMLRQKYNEDV
ncbi:YrbL family protein [Psychroserpens sp. S379A]|uniref:YrbL family protein n=1 Tax=Psychroserpens sp. S379A TaxID=3415137 RepID=UPI003C7B4D6E